MFNSEIVDKLRTQQTPFYYYDLELLRQTVIKAKEAAEKYGFTNHYALKANANPRILTIIRESGFGADCVSGNEITRALETGFSPDHIFFAGVGKTDDEINLALDNGIGCFNCESLPELEVINQLAEAKNLVAPVALRLNPNIDAQTHHYITTGLDENKFGISIAQLDDVCSKMKELPNIKFMGIHFHLGSQITDLNVFRQLCLVINDLQTKFDEYELPIEIINVGGGLGVNYKNPDIEQIPEFDTFFKLFSNQLVLRPEQKLHFELGRALVAHCGSLITRVLFVKPGISKTFLVVDAGMTDLIRPALYQAYHQVVNLTSSEPSEQYDVVGPICESSDVFSKNTHLPKSQRGDLLAYRTAGAYGETMASCYNLRTLIQAVYSDDFQEI